MIYEKNAAYIFSAIETSIDSVGETVRPLVYLPRTSLFPVFCEDNVKKIHHSYLSYFSISQVYTNFHYYETNKEEKKIRVRFP